jgi:hypothetical protein
MFGVTDDCKVMCIGLCTSALLDLFNLDSDDDVLSYMLDYENFGNQGVPLSRVSQCSCQPNNYGFKFMLLLFMFGVTDDCKVMCIGLCTSDSKGSKSCISNSFTKENNFDDIKNNSNMSQHPTKTQWFDNKRNEFVNAVHNSQGLLTTIINDLENIQARFILFAAIQ